jgi:hypothetical protein
MNSFERQQPDDELPEAVERQIDRTMDSQGLSYVDAREQVLGTTRAQRILGGDITRRTIQVPQCSTQPELYIFDDEQ